MSDKRKRKRFMFWLDDRNDDDYKLTQKIRDLKRDRQFTDVIRDGLRLIPKLMEGDTSLLFEMFPTIKDKLYAQMEADVLEELGMQRDNEVIQHIIELKGVVSQIKNRPMQSSPMQGTVSLRKVTTEEEIELEVKQVEDTNSNANQNFLTSMMALQEKK